ncbi:ribosome small subunit-dependent GTPase A [Desulfofarcimen acetoxidans DSM 771]|uniref:Small ribosomal subunit biogenesis GTPase RsgA n=1 Tax=Desulfofarcimen acetoxidans (strain ATCC 49208 / DSM 771 / KCTC 5769 / VKM B-1644 / 5575) TaxID=485916 RepID=C8VZY8_DESAS|nr:ribosome small subunit-dependent GTPase A [Desulfofarcimen acetoxidans]ACV63116.1 ribosome small subunit-dependent GTPase A [Desulfofarcimen acetoxidans DSM 771]
MIEGTVIKGYGGFYYVKDDQKYVWECKPRGRFKIEKQLILVGDRVQIKTINKKNGVVEKVLPRITELVRPPVANIDCAIVVFALKSPEPNLNLLDRFILLAEAGKTEPVICFNKVDLLSNEEVTPVLDIYDKIGYRTIVTSVKTGAGLEELRAVLKDHISVFAGPSGVGKSSLLNAVQPGLQLKTGEISEKLQRGRHTTRHVELLELDNGGYVVDTPGFSSLYLPQMLKEELAGFFPEMNNFWQNCRFNGCLHNQEPDCAVKSAVESGEINKERYAHYIMFLEEIVFHERRFYK